MCFVLSEKVATTFEIKDLRTGQSSQLQVPQSPPSEHFSTIPPMAEVYAAFETQNYVTLEREVYQRLPESLERVRQHVLKIDLESAAAGGSPGLPNRTQ
ncbi:hypothetical protein BG004_003544 [Podila humilis]|nr:hypothetical protein BG004_003544 [Podila humilis]